MTKDQFYNDITDFDLLYEFCDDVCCPLNEDWVNDLNRAADNDFPDAHSRWYFPDIRDKLNAIEEGGEWYRHDGTLEFVCIDNEFRSCRDNVALWCEQNGIFDEEEEEEEEEVEAEPEPDPLAMPPEDLSGYFGSAEIQNLTQDVAREIAKHEAQKREAARLYLEHYESLQKAHAERVLEEARLRERAARAEARECSDAYGFALI